jgi:hypothetical protein
VCYYKDGVLYIIDIITMKDTPYSEQLKMVKTLNDKYKFFAGYTDAVGVGNMLAEEI